MILVQETETASIVAVLHDVVEDSAEEVCQYSLDDLREMGDSAEIVDAVDALTRRGKDPNKEPYEDFAERAARNALARAVTIADLEDNMNVRRLAQVSEHEAERLGRYLRSWQRLRSVG
ncbi:MAG: GTP pyrophosphokinase [Chloroflexota bacterium]